MIRRDPLLGVVAPEVGWSPAIRYLLRRDRVRRLLSDVTPARLVEVGCGSGALLDELAHGGWDAVGVESSAAALSIAQAIRKASGGMQRLLVSPAPDWRQCFELALALDVLEHIEEDRKALETWREWLVADGLLLLSVPAHRRNWGAGDVWAGHYRRYDRADLELLLDRSGFDILHVECYGFPIANLVDAIAQREYRRLLSERPSMTPMAIATAASGVERRGVMRWFGWLDSGIGRLALRFAIWLQDLFVQRDWGNGYVVLARPRP